MPWNLPTPPPVTSYAARVTCIGGPSDGATLPITSGSITVDQASDVRRTGSFTVAGIDAWTPADISDALDPRAGTELLVEQNGPSGWVPQGVFTVDKPRVARDPEGVGVEVSVSDRSNRVKLAGMDRRWVVSAGTPVSDAIRSILTQIAPWIPTDFADTDELVAVDVVLEFGDDPWAACLDLAQSVGLDLYVDATGVVVTSSATAALSAEAVTVTWLSDEREIDTASIVNHVRAVWTPARPDPLPPAWDGKGGYEDAVDDFSSTSVLSWVGRRCALVKGDRSLLTSAAAARQAAQIELLRALDVTYSGRGSVAPDTSLDVGVVTMLDGDRYRITRLDIDLAGGATEVVLGVPPVDMAALLVRALQVPTDTRTREIVTSVAPLRTALASDPNGSQASVTPTAAVADVAVGDLVEVLHTGRGERIAVARFMGGTASAYGSAVLADGPWMYFPLDEASGTPVDMMGNAVPTSTTGVTLGAPGIGDGDTAATVDGGSGRGVLIPASAFAGARQFTVEILAKATNMTTARVLLGLEGSGSVFAFLLQHTASNSMEGYTGFTFANRIGSAVAEAAPTAIHHWAITYDGTTAVLYRDGVSVASEAQAWTATDATQPLYIGGRATSSGVASFLGTIGGFAFHKTALPAARILAHAQAAGL